MYYAMLVVGNTEYPARGVTGSVAYRLWMETKIKWLPSRKIN
jgi:hypothetical protein